MCMNMYMYIHVHVHDGARHVYTQYIFADTLMCMTTCTYTNVHCVHKSTMYKCIAHYISKIVAEDERKEGNVDPTN